MKIQHVLTTSMLLMGLGSALVSHANPLGTYQKMGYKFRLFGYRVFNNGSEAPIEKKLLRLGMTKGEEACVRQQGEAVGVLYKDPASKAQIDRLNIRNFDLILKSAEESAHVFRSGAQSARVGSNTIALTIKLSAQEGCLYMTPPQLRRSLARYIGQQ